MDNHNNKREKKTQKMKHENCSAQPNVIELNCAK